MKSSEFKPPEEVLEKVRKCTTTEEIENLAREYDVELSDEEISEILKSNRLEELNAAQLDRVAGGDDWGEETSKYLPANHGAYISKLTARRYRDRIVYCVNDKDPKQYCWGILKHSDTHPEYRWLGDVIFHYIRVNGTGPCDVTMECYDPDALNVLKKPILTGWRYDFYAESCTLFEYL